MDLQDDPKPRRIVVTLDRVTRDRLIELARRERRDPRDQAAVLIMDGVEDAGVYDRTTVRRPHDGDPAP